MSLADVLQSSPLSWVAMVFLVTLLLQLAAISYFTVRGILQGSLVAAAVTHDVSCYFGQQRQQNSAVQRYTSGTTVKGLPKIGSLHRFSEWYQLGT
jgi:hypothetical protein